MRRVGPLSAATCGSLALALLLSTTDARAASGTWSASVGNSYGGASGTFSASVSRTATSASIALNADGQVKFLTGSYSAISASASASLSRAAGGTASASIKLAGYTVWSRSASSTLAVSASAARTFAKGSAVITVGPVPVTISGSVGGSLNSSLTLTAQPLKIGASGSLDAGAIGTASAGVGIPGYNISVVATLDLLRYGLRPSTEATLTSLRGSVDAVERPHTVTFDVVLKAWPLKWQRNLATYTIGGWTKRLVTL